MFAVANVVAATTSSTVKLLLNRVKHLLTEQLQIQKFNTNIMTTLYLSMTHHLENSVNYNLSGCCKSLDNSQQIAVGHVDISIYLFIDFLCGIYIMDFL